MIIFSDLCNKYQIVDYSPTHNQLLIRSIKNKERDYNIDIIVKGTLHMLLPSALLGLEISIFEINDDMSYLIDEYNFKITRDYSVFALTTSEKKVFFINAMCFGVYHNKLDILETSIGRYYREDLGENILWFAE